MRRFAAILACLIAWWLVASAVAAEPIISGSWAKHVVKADIDRIMTLCQDHAGRVPWFIRIDTTSLGYAEYEGAPVQRILWASACFPPTKTGARYETGGYIDFQRGDKEQPEKWAPNDIKGRWLKIKAPTNVKGSSTSWYRDPFTIGPKVRLQDAVQVVDLAYREAIEERNRDKPESSSNLNHPIIRIKKTERSEPGQLMMDIGTQGSGSWFFYVFQKKNGQWKILERGVGFASLHGRDLFCCLTSKGTISNRFTPRHSDSNRAVADRCDAAIGD